MLVFVCVRESKRERERERERERLLQFVLLVRDFFFSFSPLLMFAFILVLAFTAVEAAAAAAATSTAASTRKQEMKGMRFFCIYLITRLGCFIWLQLNKNVAHHTLVAFQNNSEYLRRRWLTLVFFLKILWYIFSSKSSAAIASFILKNYTES